MTLSKPYRHGDDEENILRHVQTVIADHFELQAYSGAAGRMYEFPGLGTYTFALPDLCFTTESVWRLIEMNASNAAGGSTHDGDRFRVRHEVQTLLARNGRISAGAVILRPFAQDTRVLPEILVRTALLAHEVEVANGRPTFTTTPDGDLALDALNIVHGSIPAITAKLHLERGVLTYDSHPVVMIYNGNVLAQLARSMDTDLNDLLTTVPPGITHEGVWMTKLSFDKPAQQELFAGSSIVPVHYERVGGLDAAVATAKELAARFGGSIVKPGAASGGTLAVPVDPADTEDDIRTALLLEFDAMTRKYGPGWEATCPLAVYEFVHSRPAIVDGSPRRWDLRWAVHVRPEAVHVTPLLARTCPAPIDGRITKANGVGNITGRAHGAVSVLSPAELITAASIEEDDLAVAARGIYDGITAAVTSSGQPRSLPR